MFGRKKPEAPTSTPATPAPTAESDRITSYRVGQDTAPRGAGALKTTSYKNAMQFDGRGYETLN